MAGAYSSAYSSAYDVGSGAVTGTVAVTQADQTSTATGAHPHVGTSAQTQQNQTSTASGSVANPVSGTVAVTQDNQVSTAQGNNAITGTSTASQANQFSTASGNVSISVTGTVAVTQQNQTSTASGSMATGVIGSGTPTQQNQSSTTAASVLGGGAGAAEGSEAEQGHRFEAWTLPNVGTFKRKFDLTRWVGYTFSHKWSAISDGRLDLPTDFPKLAQLMTVDKADHANDIGSVIRVLIGTTPINHYVLKGLDDRWSSEQQSLTGLLEGMDYYLDRARVPNFDAPASPSVEPDWIYGAPTIIGNSDLESFGVTSTVHVVYVTEGTTSGTFTLEFNTGGGFQTTGPIDWNANSGTVAIAIEALPNIDDVLVTGTGAESNPWRIEVLIPAEIHIVIASNSANLVGGLSVVGYDTVGGVSAVDPWTQSFHPITGFDHGRYSTITVSNEQAHTGSYSLKVVADRGDEAGSYPGVQQIVSVTGGRTYRASVWVYPKFTAEYALVVRTDDETFIAAHRISLTANSWQQLTLPTVAVPAHVRRIIYRVACMAEVHGVQEFYLDDALFAPGKDAATLGKVCLDVLVPIQAEGVLTWMYPSFTATHDSAGVLWDRTHEWAVRRGQTLQQLIEYADRYNYESGGIRWNDSTARFEWDLFNPQGGGADKENSGFAVVGKMISESGTLSKRIPDATSFHTEGDTGHWGTFTDVTLAGAWGPLQKFYANGQGLDTAGLTELATRMVTDAGNRTAGLVTRLQSAPVTPWVHFKPGDRNVMVNLAPKRNREALRCMAIVATKSRDDATPVYEAHWESVVYQGEAAVLEQVRRLVRKFEAQRPATAAFDGRPDPVPLIGRGAAPSLVIAAADSTEKSKLRADYVCAGLGTDELVINNAIQELDAFGSGPSHIRAGRILLTEGTFHCTAVGANQAILFDLQNGGTLQGMGKDATIISIDTVTGANSRAIWTGIETTIRDLSIIINPATACDGIYLGGYRCTVDNVWILGNGGKGIVVSEDLAFIEHCIIETGGRGIDIIGSYGTQIRGGFIYTFANGGVGIYAQGLDSGVIQGVGFSAIWEHGIQLEECVDSLIYGNNISGASLRTGNTYDGIHVSGDSHRNQIFGNRVAPLTASQIRYGYNINPTAGNINYMYGNLARGISAGTFGTAAYNAIAATVVAFPGAAAPQGDNFT